MPAPGPRQRSNTGRNRNSLRNLASKGGNIKTALGRERTTGLGGGLNKPKAEVPISFTPKDSTASNTKLEELRAKGQIGTALRTSQLNLPKTGDTSAGMAAITQAQAAQANLTALMLMASRQGGGFGGGNVGSVPASGPLQKYAKRLSRRMFGKGHFPELNQLVMHESRWNPTVQNPNSTAYGIGQFLDATWAGVGATKTSDPYAQIRAMLKYIQGRYQTPTNAWKGYYGGNLDGPTGY